MLPALPLKLQRLFASGMSWGRRHVRNEYAENALATLCNSGNSKWIVVGVENVAQVTFLRNPNIGA